MGQTNVSHGQACSLALKDREELGKFKMKFNEVAVDRRKIARND